MRKFGIVVLALSLIFVLAGCTATSVFVNSNALAGTTITGEPQVVITQQEKDQAVQYVSHALSAGERTALDVTLEKMAGFFTFSPENPDQLIESFPKMASISGEDEFGMAEAILEALAPGVQVDAKIMAEANIDYTGKYAVNYDAIVNKAGTDIYFVPMVYYVTVNSAEIIDATHYLEQYSALGEEPLTDSDKETLAAELKAGLERYKSLVGKNVIVTNGYAAFEKQGEAFVASNETFLTPVADYTELSLANASEWAQTYIQDLYYIDVVGGNQFADYKAPITRKTFCELLMKVDSYRTSENRVIAVDPFTDTDDAYILKAYSLGVINGTSESTFNPDGLLTREQCATILANYLKFDFSTIKGSYNDDWKISPWAKEAVYRLKEANIMSGSGENFNPQDQLTIEQAITLLSKITTY